MIRRLCTRPRRRLLSRRPAHLESLECETLSLGVDGEAHRLDLFVVGVNSGIRCFENHCPHAGGPLNLFPDTFLAPNSEHLICTRHAALFRLDDGMCVQGPCAGKALARVDVCVDADGSVTVSEEALEQLCRRNAPTGRPRRPARSSQAGDWLTHSSQDSAGLCGLDRVCVCVFVITRPQRTRLGTAGAAPREFTMHAPSRSHISRPPPDPRSSSRARPQAAAAAQRARRERFRAPRACEGDTASRPCR